VNSDDAMEALEMFGEEGAKDLDFASAVEPDQKTGNLISIFSIKTRLLPFNSKDNTE
jgi:hypothetical protein